MNNEPEEHQSCIKLWLNSTSDSISEMAEFWDLHSGECTLVKIVQEEFVELNEKEEEQYHMNESLNSKRKNYVNKIVFATFCADEGIRVWRFIFKTNDISTGKMQRIY